MGRVLIVLARSFIEQRCDVAIALHHALTTLHAGIVSDAWRADEWYGMDSGKASTNGSASGEQGVATDRYSLVYAVSGMQVTQSPFPPRKRLRQAYAAEVLVSRSI